MKLEAKQRLQAEESGVDKAKELQKDHLDKQIENKEQQVENMKKSQPSRENRMHVSPANRFRNQKEQHRVEEQIDDLQLQKSKV